METDNNIKYQLFKRKGKKGQTIQGRKVIRLIPDHNGMMKSKTIRVEHFNNKSNSWEGI